MKYVFDVVMKPHTPSTALATQRITVEDEGGNRLRAELRLRDRLCADNYEPVSITPVVAREEVT